MPQFNCRDGAPNPMFAFLSFIVCLIIFIIGCVKMTNDSSDKIGYFVSGLVSTFISVLWLVAMDNHGRAYDRYCNGRRY